MLGLAPLATVALSALYTVSGSGSIAEAAEIAASSGIASSYAASCPRVWAVDGNGDGHRQVQKRSYESARFEVNCAAMLGANETVASVQQVLVDAAGQTTPALVSTLPLISQGPTSYPDGTGATAGQAVQFTLSGGLSAALYTLRVQFATSLGEQLEATVLLRVQDTPI